MKFFNKGQLQVLFSPQIIMTIIGAIVGYILAGNVGWDRGTATIIGGIIGFLISTRLG